MAVIVTTAELPYERTAYEGPVYPWYFDALHDSSYHRRSYRCRNSDFGQCLSCRFCMDHKFNPGSIRATSRQLTEEQECL